MALGRAEAAFERHGRQVSICNDIGQPRDHAIWHGNPAWKHNAEAKIIDGAGCRPYHKGSLGSVGVWAKEHRPRAGRIYLTADEKRFADLSLKTLIRDARFAVVAPYIKDKASVNKNWGPENFEKVIENLPITVLQLLASDDEPVIKGAIGLRTATFRLAAAVIARAAFVLCNEGGNHHMAASFEVPAVVIFGAFIPPEVTGYNFHHNIAVDTPEGFCGRFDTCEHCKKAMAQITPEMVRSKVDFLMAGLA